MKPEDDDNTVKLESYMKYARPKDVPIELYPNGWMSSFDLTVIYNAARRTKGKVLEIGPWLGRSSTALALGLRDREIEDGKVPVLYDIIDFGIASPDEWFQRFNQKFNMDYDDGRVAEAILHPGGSNAVLVNNLKKLGLLKYSNTIMRGDVLTAPISTKYDLVFCDALHDLAEIDRTMSKVKSLVSAKGTLIADDVVTEEMAERVSEHLGGRAYFFSRTKYKVRRRKVCVFLPER